MAIALAAGMALTGSTAAYADAGKVTVSLPAGNAAELDSSGNSLNQTTIEGTINVTTLSVTVPMKTAFDIDPNKYDDTTKANQITTQSADYKITNNSSSPIWVYVSAVAQDKVKLVQSPAKLSEATSMMLAIKKSGTKTDTAMTDENFWLKTDGGAGYKYVLDPDTDTTSDSTLKGKIAANSEMSLELYALTKTGWTHGNTFTVQPSFMITIADPSL